MEESSNEKFEEIQKVEKQDGDKELVIEDSGGLKTEAISVREVGFNGNSESADEKHDEDDSSSHSSSSDEEPEPKGKGAQKVDSGELEHQIATDSVFHSVEPEISSPSEALNEVAEVPVDKLEALDDVAEPKSKEIGGHISQPLDETNGVSADETNEDSKLIEGVILPPSDKIDGSSQVGTQVVSKGMEEITVPSVEEKGIEEIPLSSSGDKGVVTLPPSNKNVEIPPTKTADVVSKATGETKLKALEQNPEESSGTAESESKEKVDESSPEAANGGSADINNARDYDPESNGNPPIPSLTQRTVPPTSWRSCCGLLDVLRRSDR